jgi:MoxR-like ATPase
VIGQEIESTNPALRPDEFVPGPLFANAVVLDEFNRATPRMQSGLLEAMEEHAVTVGKRRHPLPKPFFCIGTMNPHDNSGTFEMAHASCDRFAMRTGIGYPSELGERDLLMRFGSGAPRHETDPIVAPGDVVQLQRVIAQLPAGEPVRAYLVRLLRSTREHPDVLVGASPRALLSMYRCAQAAALLDNAAEVAVKHVRSLFEPCIAHRLRVRPEASARAVCEEILERTPVPVTAPPPTIAANENASDTGSQVRLVA